MTRSDPSGLLGDADVAGRRGELAAGGDGDDDDGGEHGEVAGEDRLHVRKRKQKLIEQNKFT